MDIWVASVFYYLMNAEQIAFLCVILHFSQCIFVEILRSEMVNTHVILVDSARFFSIGLVTVTSRIFKHKSKFIIQMPEDWEDT
jgi:thymidine kinase